MSYNIKYYSLLYIDKNKEALYFYPKNGRLLSQDIIENFKKCNIKQLQNVDMNIDHDYNCGVYVIYYLTYLVLQEPFLKDPTGHDLRFRIE